MPPTLKSAGVDHFGVKSGEKGVDRCKPNCNTIRERHGAVIGKRNRVLQKEWYSTRPINFPYIKKTVNGSQYYRVLESISIASALSRIYARY